MLKMMMTMRITLLLRTMTTPPLRMRIALLLIPSEMMIIPLKPMLYLIYYLVQNAFPMAVFWKRKRFWKFYSTPLQKIPYLIFREEEKDVYFVVQNENNKVRRAQGMRSQFWDDRGAWLLDCPQEPVLRSDDEKALRLAMACAFPNAPRLTCTRHLKLNFSRALADKVGWPKQERQHLGNMIFGDNGIIAHAADHIDVVDRLQHQAEGMENVSVRNMLQHNSPLLAENVKGLKRPRKTSSTCCKSNLDEQ
ncbi:hypothetical protein ElyMa_005699300 [Elysia marginata]|uniref:MULE transposase domain-containing protein n=1 Tax=Elysia marginata TaxID=1093978 RepID=A0AAV4FGL9_9GAST|nr:hypothetical protein ElyMa_005699300 [Elysia marginata]